EPKPPPPEPEPEPEAPQVAAVKPVAAPEPELAEAPPPESPDAKPLRVVGLSLEATVEGGGGPSFAVGQTRLGETADRAADPRLKAEPTAKVAAPTAPAPTASVGANRAASRIPTAKVAYQMPKRKRPRLPAYPVTLKSQGVEADVTVMVTLDAAGKVTDVKIISPASYPEFNEAARAAALAEEFEPALRDGVPVAYTLSYTYRFRIEER
ncbi:MAG TPA: TonB family protein, partial [Polyangiaceae bacterium]|nr:TonB family protein [Polyangiaceae bacterium]